MYINCKTYFSLRYGTFSTEALVKAAMELGVTTLALTNINTTCDAWEFVKCCRKENIKPIVGAEIRNGDQLLYIVLAKNNAGLAAINRFLSEHLMEEKPFPDFSVIDGCYTIYPIGKKPVHELSADEFIGIQYTELGKLYGVNALEKFIVRQPVTVQSKGFFNIHKLLRAIDHNVVLSKLPAEAVCGEHETFISPDKLLQHFSRYPSIVMNTWKLMDSCSIEMEFGKDKTKQLFSSSGNDDKIFLAKLAYDGMQWRYGLNNKEAKKRVDKELLIIDQLGFNAYFLIAWDIIRYAQGRGYYHVGRGSGANSIVAYCLQITDVDPIELDLFFERFLNPHRTSPPDFDIDFSWTDRDDVFDYIFKRYGRDHVALLGVYSTFNHRSLAQELGKVFGLPDNERKELSENNGNVYPKGSIQAWILYFSKFLSGFPNYIGIHAGGVIISEEPIYAYTSLFMPPKGFATAQIDMYYGDDIGLYKLDILSQRGLGHIKDSLKLIKQNQSIDINIHEVNTFKKDPKLNHNLSIGNSIGCFYIESPSMRHVNQKLHCSDYETLVAASSIIRPGVGRSGMMTEYIARHNKREYQSLHPKLAEILKSTYEVMVYQEDIIRVVHEWAGLTMAEADLLRRATSFKYRVKDQMGYLRQKFFSNCMALGYEDKTVAEVWRQIESFAEFSFCKAHSASFAVESYQSLHLKTYYPREFMVAVINNFGGFYGRELYFYELAKAGADIHPPCVNNGDVQTNIKGIDVWVGLHHIKELRNTLAQKIITERNERGSFLSLQDFIERTDAGIEQLNILIRVGAFAFTGKSKKELLWEASFLQKKNEKHVPAHESLFGHDEKKFELPELPIYEMDDAYDQIEILEFPVGNPFHIVDEAPSQFKLGSDMKDNLGKVITLLGYHITHKPVSTVHGQQMSFGTFIDVAGNWIDSVHFPDIHRRLPPKSGFYKITGKVTQDFGVYSIEVVKLEKAGIKKRRHAIRK
ncbi:MAG: DNA polymerase III subunit alpha [Bacteroidetes bacterium]|nr:DNA polymerase III subunit alpha [Bacteroidota bacterium]